ncbi:hypothetical protein QQP08_007533 [Theobroma cacao]|nr:hypothetical protein QQP08_007533 [Theobroma cacao]
MALFPKALSLLTQLTAKFPIVESFVKTRKCVHNFNLPDPDHNLSHPIQARSQGPTPPHPNPCPGALLLFKNPHLQQPQTSPLKTHKTTNPSGKKVS